MSAELGSNYIDTSEKTIELKELMRIIKEQVSRGQQIILNMQKMANFGNEGLYIKPIKLHDVLNEVIYYIKKSYVISEISVKVDSIPKNVMVQANDLLKDIFENILINSINYNNSTKIEIFVKISQIIKKNEGKYIKIEFIDNGIGIPNSKKESIFDRYSNDKGGKGLGMGLSLVKQIVEIFKGKIWVEDNIKGDYSQGSNFVVLIPEIYD